MKIKIPKQLTLDGNGVLKEALERLTHANPAIDAARRNFLRRSLTLGGLSMLTGCALIDEASVESALKRISSLNDEAQTWLFDPNRLAPTYPDSMITRPFPFNAFYSEDEVPAIDGDSFRLEVRGLVADKRQWSLPQLRAMPQIEQITRHICVEGWSAIGKWGVDLSAKYVGFMCADDYFTSIDMPTALHPQTTLALTYDGQALQPKYGFPLKLRIPTKLGYKNPKHIQAIYVINTYPGGYWEDQGYNWFGGS